MTIQAIEAVPFDPEIESTLPDFDSIELSDVIDAPALQVMMNYHYAITGVGIGIIDIKGEVLVSTGWQEICVKFHRATPESCKLCLESNVFLSRGVEPGTFKVYRCKNNMREIVTPIMLGNRHIGNIFLGQFLYDDEEPDYDLFRAQSQRFGYDEVAYIAALDSVSRFSRETVQNAMAFYSKLAQMISESNYNKLVQEHTLADYKRSEKTKLLLKETLREKNKKLQKALELLRLQTQETIDQLKMRLSIAADSAKIGVWEYCIQEELLVWDKQMFVLYGICEEDFSGAYDAWQNGLHLDDRKHCHDEFTRGMLAEKDYSAEFRVVWPSGEVRHIKANALVLHDVGGEPIRMIGVNIDITKQKLAENSLRDAKEFARSTLDGLSAHICVVNAHGEIIATNLAWDSFGTENGAAEGACGEGTSYLAVCQSTSEEETEEIEEFRAGISAVLNGTVPEFIKEYPCPSPGRERWFTCGVNPFTINGASYAVISHEDITKRMQADSERLRLIDEQRIILENAGVGISYVKNREIQWVNSGFCAMFGYSVAEIANTSTRQLFPSQDDYEQFDNEVYSTLAATGETVMTTRIAGGLRKAPKRG